MKKQSAVSAPSSSTVQGYVSYLQKKGSKPTIPVPEFSPLGIAKAKVRELTNAAFAGNAEAAKALVLIADEVAAELEAIWEGWACLLSSRDSEFEKAREPHREMLRRIARERETWPVLHHCRAAKRKTTDQMLKELELGTMMPLKAVDVKDDYMRYLIDSLSYDIGALSADNAKEWVQRAMNYIETSEPPGMRLALRTPHTWLYGLADPARQVGKRQKAAYKRLEKWEEQKKGQHKSGELSIEESEAKERRIMEIKNYTVTEAELVYGLKEALTARVKSIVEKRPQI